MTDENPTPPAAPEETLAAVPAASQEQVDAHAGVLDAHTEQIGSHEAWLAELERNLGDRIDRLEARIGVRTAADTDDPQKPKSMAKNDDGLEGGHAGPGTGDGPAGG